MQLQSEFIKEGEINISAEDWIRLNSRHSKEYLIEMLSNLIEGLPLPLRKITEEEAKTDFENLCALNTRSFFKKAEFYTRYAYINPLHPSCQPYVLDSPNIGGKSSNYFHQYNRFLCDSINSPSPYRVWTIPKFRKSLLNSLWTLKVKEINNNTLRSCISLRKYIASQFKPSAAKAIYDIYEAEHVLDFSAGWGDRLAGFAAGKTTKSYVGIDPNSLLHSGYQEQINFYNVDKEIKVINSAAEDVDFSIYKGYFDIIFTSPPYFCTERYCNESTQSYKRYKKLDVWLNNFLFKVLYNTKAALKKGGLVVINISDVYLHHQINKICDPMVNFCTQKLNYEYCGVLGLKMAKRPNSKAMGEGIFAEPIWLFRNND